MAPAGDESSPHKTNKKGTAVKTCFHRWVGWGGSGGGDNEDRLGGSFALKKKLESAVGNRGPSNRKRRSKQKRRKDNDTHYQ